MDQSGGNNESQSQDTNHSSTINLPSFSLGSQQASILQVGGQSFLILALGQQVPPLQGLGLNLVPVGGPDATSLQTGGPQAHVQLGGVQPTVSQIDGSIPLINPAGSVPPNTVQIHGLQTATVQGGETPVQANELSFKPSQSNPLTSTAQVGELLSSLVQGRFTVPPQSSTLLTHAPEIKSEPDLENTQTGDCGNSSVQMRSTMIKAETVPLPTCKIEFDSTTEKTFNQDVVQNSGVMAPLSQIGSFHPNIVQFSHGSSSSQGTSTVPMQAELSQAQANVKTEPGLSHSHPNIKTEPGLEDAESKPLTFQVSGSYGEIANLIGFTSAAQSTLFQPSSGLTGGLQSLGHQENSSSGQVGGCETVPLPTCKIEIQSATEKTFDQDVVQNSGVMPPLNQIGSFHPNIVQFGGLQSSSSQGTSAVPMQAELSQAHANIKTEPGLSQANIKTEPGVSQAHPSIHTQPVLSQAHPNIKTEPGLEDAESQPLTIQASERYGEISNLIGFTSAAQSTLFQPSSGLTGGLQSLVHQENAQNVVVTNKNKQPLIKKATKYQQDYPKYIDVACTAENLVKMKNAYTNTMRKHKSIGTQAKFLLQNKSQASQFPEKSYGESAVSSFQECSTQSEDSFWPGQVGFRQSCESHPYKVVIVRDSEPENVSIFLSETRGDSDPTCDMEGVEKWLHESYETEHPHFDDVAVYFTEEEWACLNNKEKKLYKKVMMDNYWNLMAVGMISVTPPVISKIERGEEPYMRSLQQAEYKPFLDSDSKDDLSSQDIFEHYNIQGFYERLKMTNAPIRLAMAGMTVTKIMSEASFPESPHPAQVEDKIRDPGENCPFRLYLKDKPVISEKPFRCFKCELTFKHFGTLSRHYQRVHQSDKDLTCSECGKKFSKMKALLLHFMRHTGERPFVCTGCGKTFTSRLCLNNHYGANAKKKPYECYQCGKQFGLKHSLVKHEKVHQPDDHICLICGKQFLNKTGLRLHENTHGGCVCSHCGRYFSCKEDCEKHMLDHRQVQLFVCAECGNAFIYESQLIEHQNLHKIDRTNLEGPDLLIDVQEED